MCRFRLLSAAMTWKLPGYVVEELLGFGGSGEVWRGRVSAHGDPVALKRLPITEPAQIQAARAEAALLSTLDHPHLIRLHELVPVRSEEHTSELQSRRDLVC